MSEFSCIGWSFNWGKIKFLANMIKQCNRTCDIFLVNDWSCRKTSQPSTLTNHLNSIIPRGFKMTSSIFKQACWLEISKQPFSWDKIILWLALPKSFVFLLVKLEVSLYFLNQMLFVTINLKIDCVISTNCLFACKCHCALWEHSVLSILTFLWLF